ncbi:hypothetical protein DFH09DRAFT_594166 [Mycena vulgaris]|nr:hypothetical protein DFH09DRAFT_594166 [Mycena vulgaris]
MRFLSAIYVSSVLSLAAIAAPLAHPPSGNGITDTSPEGTDTSVLAGRTGADVFEELDLTGREIDVELDLRAFHSEAPVNRTSQPSGCVIG